MGSVTLLRQRPGRVASAALGLLILVVLAVALTGPSSPRVALANEVGQVPAAGSYHIWLPPPDRIQEPLPVLLVLHGLDGNGPTTAGGFVREATGRGWLVVAPTFVYGDWRDPRWVATEDPWLAYYLAQILDSLPVQSGYQVRPQAMVFGFSRGAQLGQRFAFFHPERVRGVFALAAGTYTVPWLTDGRTWLNLPYGLGDAEARLGRPLDWNAMRGNRFVVAVGANDTRSADVPRQWDSLLGTNRVERARSFHEILVQSRFQSQIIIYPGAGHTLTGAMRRDALEFFDAVIAEEALWSGAARDRARPR